MANEFALQDKKSTIGDLLRSGSCTGEPQTNAVNCMKTKQLTVFADILNETDFEANSSSYPLPAEHWINQPIPEEDDKSLLFIALEQNLYDYIQVLLQAGADVSLFNPKLKKFPIHVAVKTGNCKMLSLLFKYERNRPDVNATLKNGRTALHICAENEYLECLKFLLSQKGIDVNCKDKRDNQTPLYLAVKKGAPEIVTLLIEHGADLGAKSFGKTMLEHIKEKMPYFNTSSVQVKRVPLVNQISTDTKERIGVIIDNVTVSEGDEDLGLEEFSSLLLQLNKSEIDGLTYAGYNLLHKAIEAEAVQFVKILLEDGKADPNCSSNSNVPPPLLIAARKGNFEIMSLLFQHNVDLTAQFNEETILHCLLKRESTAGDKFHECLHLVLRSGDGNALGKIVNKRDKVRNTALHYATQLWSQEIVRDLLEIGANIGMKNHWNEVPISKITPETMEAFLDEFCLRSEGDVNHENFELTFNYSFLAPPIEDLPYSNRGLAVEPEFEKLDDTEDIVNIPLPETLSLWHMSQSKEHGHLLKHPVITSFLYLKWGRIRRDFNRNLRFYLLFVYMLTWYIFNVFTPPKTGSISFWHALFIPFALIIILFVLRDWAMDFKDAIKQRQLRKNEQSDMSFMTCCYLCLRNWVEVALLSFVGIVLVGGGNVNVIWTGLLILLAILVIREIFQMTVSLKRYIFSPENWLEVTVIVVLVIILFGDDDSKDLKRHLSAIAIVTSWAELITLVGKHPKLTTYNVYVMMFYKVMGTFFFFLCWYAFFIIAFGLGFFVMLHKDPDVEAVSDEDYVFFNNPWLALVKTSTMFVGELEFSDIPINLESPLVSLDYIFFLCFVFLIVVVLMNLLNGLAVSDTGLIQEKAEIVSYISRVDTISYTESILLGDPFNFLSNWPALKWLSRLPSCSFCAQIYRSQALQKVFLRLTGATDILLFFNFLPKKKFTFNPNSKKADCSLLQISMMDSDIIESAKNVVLNKQSKSKETLIYEKIHHLEQKLDSRLHSIEENLKNLLKTIREANTK